MLFCNLLFVLVVQTSLPLLAKQQETPIHKVHERNLHQFLLVNHILLKEDLKQWEFDMTFLCLRDDSQGALRFAPVSPSVCLSVCPSVRLSVRPFVTLYGIEFV